MSIHALDASTWEKRSVVEEGSQRMNAWGTRNLLVASAALGVTAVLSPIAGNARAGDLSEAARDRIVDHGWDEAPRRDSMRGRGLPHGVRRRGLSQGNHVQVGMLDRLLLRRVEVEAHPKCIGRSLLV